MSRARAGLAAALVLAGAIAALAIRMQPPPSPDVAPRRWSGSLLAAASVDEDGGSIARVEVLFFGGSDDGSLRVERIEDPRSSVFHVARCDPSVPGAVLTAAGTSATISRWRRDAGGRWSAEDLWRAAFGPRSSRMRDFEITEGGGLGRAAGPALVVGTHDEGVIAIVAPSGSARVLARAESGRERARHADGRMRRGRADSSTVFGSSAEVEELDRRPHTLVHEIEVGDLDGDGLTEVYATVSPPNTLVAGIEQPGQVVRYVPARGPDRELVLDLAPRHAKEILVVDLDGDGRDELYVVVEARTASRGGETVITEPVEIRRVTAGGPPETIAVIPERLMRFVVAGDLDGDGRKELVAAGMSSGTWWLRPQSEGAWDVVSIDRRTGGFEHAITTADLDGDGRDELYEADDPSGELRRVTWTGERFEHEVLLRHRARSQITWSLVACR